MFLYHQVDVVMTAPKIEHVRSAQSRVTFGDNFQVVLGESMNPLTICCYI